MPQNYIIHDVIWKFYGFVLYCLVFLLHVTRPLWSGGETSISVAVMAKIFLPRFSKNSSCYTCNRGRYPVKGVLFNSNSVLLLPRYRKTLYHVSLSRYEWISQYRTNCNICKTNIHIYLFIVSLNLSSMYTMKSKSYSFLSGFKCILLLLDS